MEKDFDKWNDNKKIIDSTGKTVLYHAQEVWWCRLGLNIGAEQDGTGLEFERPVLIIKGLSSNTCIVLPLTSSTKIHPMRIPIGIIQEKHSSALLSQIKVIDTKRLIKKVCWIDEKMFNDIRKAVRDLF